MGFLDAALREAKKTRKRKRRNLLDIFAAILSVVKKAEQTKPAIIYKANINSSRAKKYLLFLLSKGLIQARDGRNGTTYSTTKNGIKFLQDYKEVKELENEFSKGLEKIQGYLGVTEAEENPLQDLSPGSPRQSKRSPT